MADTIISTTMTYGDYMLWYVEIQLCPVCGSEMEIVEHNGDYSVRCPHCRYDYGGFKQKDYLVGAWNALATVFPMSVQIMANSIARKEAL